MHLANTPKGIVGRIRGFGAWRAVLEFNWAWVAFYAFFLAYGYYGALAPGLLQFKAELLPYTGQLFMLAGVQIGLGWAAWKGAAKFNDSLSVTARDVLVFISLALMLLTFSFDRLQFSLFSDELSYAGSAHGHGIYLAMAVARHFPALDGYVFKYLVQTASLLLVVAITVLFYVSGRWSPKVRITVFVSLLVLGRLIFAIKGGNGSPHPPLHLVPPFVVGTLMGISDISFKLSYYLAYIGFLTLLCKMLIRISTWNIAYLATLTIGTIPLLSNLSTVVEHSFWSFLCFSLVFTEIVTSAKLSYARLICLVSILTMMRQPSFLALVPVFLLYALETYRVGFIKQRLGECTLLFLPLLLFLPFLASSLMHGTPSTIPLEQSSNFDRVFQAIGNGIVWDSVSRAFPLWWLAFIPFCFVPLQRKSLSLNIAFILFLALAIYVYYSIHVSLWGYAKYQAEYAAPLAIAGFLLLLKAVTERDVHRLVLLSGLTFLLVLNTMKLTEQNYRDDMWEQSPEAEYGKVGDEFGLLKSGMTAIPYEYKSTYAYIKQIRLSENTYSIGATYGVLPEIMNDYTSRAVRASYEIYFGQKANRLETAAPAEDVDMIESDSRIKAVIVGSTEKKQELVAGLNGRGWRNVAEYRNSRYGTSVAILKRP